MGENVRAIHKTSSRQMNDLGKKGVLFQNEMEGGKKIGLRVRKGGNPKKKKSEFNEQAKKMPSTEKTETGQNNSIRIDEEVHRASQLRPRRDNKVR